MSAFEELRNKTGGVDGATPLEWCVVEMHKSYNPKRAEQAAAELAALRERVKVLENAIKPFAEIPCLENFDDDQTFEPAGGVLAGDVRKARAALRGDS